MKLTEVEDYDFSPDTFSLMNFFKVEENLEKNGSVTTFFNLNEGVTVDGIENVLQDGIEKYVCKNGDNIRFISYRKYGTIHYWWLIAKINGIYDSFEELESGRVIYLLSKQYMNYLSNLIFGRKNSNA